MYIQIYNMYLYIDVDIPPFRGARSSNHLMVLFQSSTKPPVDLDLGSGTQCPPLGAAFVSFRFDCTKVLWDHGGTGCCTFTKNDVHVTI